MRRAIVTALVIVALAAALRAGPADAYPWPVKPFDRPHPVRGSFGDPRTVFRSPPTTAGVRTANGSFSFHNGVDISAPNGTAVYPVAAGVVTRVAAEEVSVSSAAGTVFQYWHITPTIRVGATVTARRTVLGHVQRPAGHVHLTEIAGGHPVNPLRRGHLAPYRDSTRPWIARLALRTSAGADLLPNQVGGRVVPVAEAYDRPTIHAPGTWAQMPVTPAQLTWRVETWAGKVAIPETTAWDVRETVPANALFWHAYARGTFQNMAVFANHYSLLQPGCFLFRLVDEPLDTTRLANGVYELVVTASDVAGHRSARRLRFTVWNPAGSTR